MGSGTTYRVRRFQDPAAFLARAEPWLLQAEAEHNLAIGIARQLAAGTMLSGKPVYLAVIERDEDTIVGCAFRTPPYKLGITRMPADAVKPLAEDTALVYDAVPAVMGEPETARRFAQAWAATRNATAVEGIRHRIYQLDHVVQPKHRTSGTPRRATAHDAPLVADWIDAFSREAGVQTDNAVALAAARIEQRSLYLWDVDGSAVSMAAWSGQTPNGRRVGYVYTPAQHRRRGYATALVAHVSEQILGDGCRFCFLYTDLANPVSNSIYQQIGYNAVCDVTDWNLITPSEQSI